MKVAKAKYNGRKGKHRKILPSGASVVFPARHREDPWVDITDVDIARKLSSERNYEVEWTNRGRLAAKGRDVLELGYQKKRSLAADLDLSFDGQPSEDEVDEALEDYIQTMEKQRP